MRAQSRTPSTKNNEQPKGPQLALRIDNTAKQQSPNLYILHEIQSHNSSLAKQLNCRGHTPGTHRAVKENASQNQSNVWACMISSQQPPKLRWTANYLLHESRGLAVLEHLDCRADSVVGDQSVSDHIIGHWRCALARQPVLNRLPLVGETVSSYHRVLQHFLQSGQKYSFRGCKERGTAPCNKTVLAAKTAAGFLQEMDCSRDFITRNCDCPQPSCIANPLI